MTEAEAEHDAKIILHYLQLHEPVKKCDALLVLCSFDTRVADYAAQLFLQGFGEYIIFSGNGRGRITEQLFDKSEAETFAGVARKAGISEDKIIIEDQSTNSGENIRFTYELLQKKHLYPRSLLIVQRPSMERRAYATFKKQWPNKQTRILVTSPPIPYDKLGDAVNHDKRFIIEVIVGDLQRIKLYSETGFQIPQEIPAEVWGAYERLVAAGYTRRLIKESA